MAEDQKVSVQLILNSKEVSLNRFVHRIISNVLLGILKSLKIDDETKIIYDAIYVHSDKGLTQSPFDEVLKDADTFQSWLYNPLVESIGGKRSDRLNKLMAEFGIARDTKLVA